MVAASILAVVVVLALAVYAGRLLWRLRQQGLLQQQQEAVYREKKKEHEDYLIDSIHLIARSLMQDELDLSEGVIRLKYLLDTLGLPEQERAAFAAVDDLYDKVRIFDTHTARRQLSPGERFRQDGDRARHEEAHRDAVMMAVRRLVDHEFRGSGSAAPEDERSQP